MDGAIVAEVPDGWDELETSVKVDRSLVSARLVTVDTRLTWHRDGYRYLWERFHGSDGCTQVELIVEEDPHDLGEWVQFYRGFVKLPAASWSYEPDQVTAPVEDASFYAFLSNNKSIKVPLDLTLTKNGEPLTPLVPHAVQMFQSVNGAYVATRQLYVLDEVLRYLVAYLSDNQVQVRSAALEPGGEFDRYAVQTGYRLSTNLTDKGVPSFTLSDFITQSNRKFNLGAQLELTGAVPVLRVEPVDYFYQVPTELALAEIHPVEAQIDTARLYATVRVGSETINEAGPFPERARWQGFAEEEYYLLGQCNVDSELDLTGTWVVSSNVIEDVAINASTDHDEEIFLVELTDRAASPLQAHQSQFMGGTRYFYNEHLTNKAVVERWLNGIPQSLAAELGRVPVGTFQANQRTLPTSFQHRGFHYTGGVPQVDSTFAPLGFDDDYTAPGFDTGGSPGVYGNATPQGTAVTAANSRFTCPLTGLYSLQFGFRLNYYRKSSWDGSAYRTGAYQMRIKYGMRRYSATNVLLEDTNSGDEIIVFGVGSAGGNIPPCGTDDVSSWINRYWSKQNWVLNTGDYVVAYLEVHSETNPAGTGGPFPGPCPLIASDYRYVNYTMGWAYFACTQTSNNFGDFKKIIDPNATRNVLLKFTAPLTYPEFRGLLANLSGAVQLDTQARRWRGWVESLKYDHGTNQADVTLLTSKNQLPE